MKSIKTVAIIPARGGSKGIKNKNIVDFLEKPLISYNLVAAKECELVDLVVVSTDSESIADVAKSYCADVKIINRPADISDSMATSETAILHAIDVLSLKYPEIENIVFLQATSPLTTSEDIDKLVQGLDNSDSVAFYIEDYGFFFEVHDMVKPREPRQIRTPLKRECGNGWAFKKKVFVKDKTRLCGNYSLIKLDYPKNLEIDTMEDLLLLENILKAEPNE